MRKAWFYNYLGPSLYERMDETEFKVYSNRWVILSVFCALEMSNALLWVTFAPISDLAQIYFGGKDSYYGSTTSINM